MEKDYDIIIMGAGPAGCFAGILLAEKFNVLIIEKRELPREKPCSGVLIKKSVDLLKKHIGHIPESVMCSPIKTTGLTVVTTDNSYDFLDEGLNIHRKKFDYWLACEAKKRGVTILDNTNIKSIDSSDFITIQYKENKRTITIKSKILLACDGINGNSRKLMGLPSQKKMITYQKFYNGGIDMDKARFYAYTDPRFSDFDAWVNYKDDMIIVGVISNTITKAKEFHLNFLGELATNKNLQVSKEIRDEIWCLPIIDKEYASLLSSKRVFFCGEVAGILNPFGEGISGAFTSAIELSKSCLEFKDDLDNIRGIEELYKHNMKSELEYMIRQWEYIKSISKEFKENRIFRESHERVI